VFALNERCRSSWRTALIGLTLVRLVTVFSKQNSRFDTRKVEVQNSLIMKVRAKKNDVNFIRLINL